MSSSEKRSKQTRSSSFRKDRLILFLTGCGLGVACFLWVYGAKIINPLYDAWLFNTDMDLKQHYIGWCHYRMSDWHFPVGLIDTLSYPTSVSVIYTDSIPIVALIFKLFRNILPQRFQYFGMFGLVSLMLMGGISSLLIHTLISGAGNTKRAASADDRESVSDTAYPFINKYFEYIVSAAASMMFILSFTVLQRMFYHTALGAQWIIVLALYVWVRRVYNVVSAEPAEDQADPEKRNADAGTKYIYAFMGLLCVCIHTYYVPMVGSILLAASVTYIIKSKQDLINAKSTGKEAFPVVREIINLIFFCLAGVLTLFVFGGFYGASSGYADGYGSFISNLNTFINPLYGSIILKPMKLYYDWQYEGYGYLGIGVFLCMLVILMVWGCTLREEKIRGAFRGFGSVKEYMKDHPYRTVGAVLLAVDFALAVFPMVTFSDKKLFGIPMPQAVRSVFSIFRSNGRFIWVPVYLIMTGATVYAYRLLSAVLLNARKGKSILLKTMLLLVLLQVLDTTKVVSEKQKYFCAEQTYTNIWAMAPFPAGDPKYREFVFLYNDNDIIMDTAFYAYLNGKCLNNYYYARNIDDEINGCIDSWRKELHSGTVRDDVIYIFKKEDPLAEALREWSEEEKKISGAGADVRWYEIDDGHTAFVR